MKSRHLATGEETLLQLIKHKLAVAAKIFLNLCSAREGGGQEPRDERRFFFPSLICYMDVGRLNWGKICVFYSALILGPRLSKMTAKKEEL